MGEEDIIQINALGMASLCLNLKEATTTTTTVEEEEEDISVNNTWKSEISILKI